jgi:hypothetical protein
MPWDAMVTSPVEFHNGAITAKIGERTANARSEVVHRLTAEDFQALQLTLHRSLRRARDLHA